MRRVNWKLTVAFLAGVCLIVGQMLGNAQDADAPASSEPDPFTPAPADAPFLLEPTTPEGYFEAVVQSVKLARPRVARAYLEKFLATNPDDEMLLQLREEYGVAEFLKWSNIEALQPLSVRLLDRVNEAFRQAAGDPQRIDMLIDALSGEPSEREAAIAALRGGGAAVVPRFLQRFEQAGRRAERELLARTLLRLGRPIVPALIAAIDAPSADLRATVIELLGRLNDDAAVPYLWHPAFAPNQPPGVQSAAQFALKRLLYGDARSERSLPSVGIADELRTLALRHFALEYPWTVGDDGLVELWFWAPQRSTVQQARITPQKASLFTGSQRAQEALDLIPENRQAQALVLAFALASDVAGLPWSASLPTGPGTAFNLALTAGPEVLSDALTLALTHRNEPAARAALSALSQISSRQQLQYFDRRRSPLQAALNYPDSAVQLAAASAILELDPVEPFAGSERIVRILGRALSGTATAQVLVADANVQRRQHLAALMGQLGYEQIQVSSGREAFDVSATRPDVELILLHANLVRTELSQTIANLRADARTAALPIVIYGQESVRPRLAHLLRHYELLTFVPERETLEAFRVELDPFLTSIQGTQPSSADLAAQRKAAASWLAQLASTRRNSIFDLRPIEDAVYEAALDDDLAVDLIAVVASLPTHAAQQTLLDWIRDAQRPVALRVAAARHLAFHMQRFGLLLNETQTQQLRDAYQQAQAGTDPGDSTLATALASVMGTLKPDSTLVRQRLRDFRFAPVPQAVGAPE